MKLADASGRAGLFQDLADAPGALRRFGVDSAREMAAICKEYAGLLLVGEGSSRTFPARQAIARARRAGDFSVATMGCAEAALADLSRVAVLGASNSGRTAELVGLFTDLRSGGHPALFSLSANPASLTAPLARGAHTLACGAEHAVAATKSVLEQGLFVSTLVELRGGRPAPDAVRVAQGVQEAVQAEVPDRIAATLAAARTVYFAGLDDGVAEELALKCNEILRRPSRYLEGTFLLHGVEEVMGPEDALVVVDPFEGTEAKILEVLGRTGISFVGLGARAIEGVDVGVAGEGRPYALLAAGWLLLGLAGLSLGIDVDRPLRARKIGNEAGK